MNTQKYLKILTYFFKCLIITFAVLSGMQVAQIDEGLALANGLWKTLYIITNGLYEALKTNGIETTCIFFIIVYLQYKLKNLNKEKTVCIIFGAMLLALLKICSIAFQCSETLSILWETHFQIIKTILIYIGYCLIYVDITQLT